MKRFFLLLGAALLCGTCGAVAAQSSTAPTYKTLSPEAADLAWQKATAKFEPQRKAIIARVDQHMNDGQFHPDWASLQHYRSPAWYDDAKFGIFIHWGVYSVPAFGSEWYSRNMYQQGTPEFAHHVATYGPQSKFGYKDFIPMFKAEHFDPQAWAALFKEAGARYVVPVAEHHDGFAMYDSSLSDWTAAKMGPHRDVIGELEKAVRGEGLHFGVSSHRAEHDWFFAGGRTFDSDVNDPRYAGLYGPAEAHLTKNDEDLANDWTYVSQAWLDDWLARTAELIDRYHPDLIYFDWWIGHPTFRNTLPKMLAYYYNEGAHRGGVVVNYKMHDFAPGAGTLDIERGQLVGIQQDHWQTDTSISNASWGYIQHDTYKSPREIIHLLVDVVSKNGNLMLNIGPRADGTIPEDAQTILRAIGGWLKTNVCRLDRMNHDLAVLRPRQFDGVKRAIAGRETEILWRIGLGLGVLERASDHFGRPFAKHAPRLGGIDRVTIVRAVSLLANGQRVEWKQQPDGLHLSLSKQPVGHYAYVYRIEMGT
ncbi:alpha-L-fucosidase [Dyella monticola]|uniref:alpha-L-fucosidase n=1 Tax=Dyella monticola TaxID=1927958 RepID=A0A370X5P4_9GAMM|nr:alpha-L-fucosidase [Dyella monticola]